MVKKLLIVSTTIGTFLAVPISVLAQAPTGAPININVPSPPNFRITDFGKVISSTFAFLLIVAGLLAFAYLIIGGIQWITSGGDKAGLEAARNRIVHAIVGLIVVFSAWAITLLIQQFIGVSILGGLTLPVLY